MTTNYNPVDLPTLIDRTAQTLDKIEKLNHPDFQKTTHGGLSFFRQPTDQQMNTAEQQLRAIQEHIKRLESLSDHYFTAALNQLPLAMEASKPLGFDEMQIFKGRLEANAVMIERTIAQKTVDEPKMIRFLANQLTDVRKSVDDINALMGKFVDHHSRQAIRNTKRIDGLALKVAQLQRLLPEQDVEQPHNAPTMMTQS